MAEEQKVQKKSGGEAKGKRQIDMKRLFELTQMGKSAGEMMQELNIKEEATLQQALQELMREKGEPIHVPGLIGRPSISASYTSEGIRISPEMLESSTFRKGDAFDLKLTEDGITLTKQYKPK